MERSVRRCLEKSPEARFQSASDLAYNLRAISTDPAIGELTPTTMTPSRRRRGLWVVLAAAVLAGALVSGWIALSRSRDVSPARAVPLTAFPGFEYEPAISPDGTHVAFTRPDESGNPEVHVMLVDGGEPAPLGRGSFPAWSPDGHQVALVRHDGQAGHGVHVITLLDRAERRVALTRAGAQGYGLSWSPDGKLLAMIDRPQPGSPTGITLLSLDTGDMRVLTTPPADHDGDSYPRFSPDGLSVAFSRQRIMGESDVFVVPTAGGEPRRLTTGNRADNGLDWTPDGRRIVFSCARSGRVGLFNLWEVPAAGGEPEPLDIGEGGFEPALSRQRARLVYSKGTRSGLDLWRVGGPAAEHGEAPPAPFIASTDYNNYPEYSPDGQRIVFGSHRTGLDQLWICDADGSNASQLTQFEDRRSSVGRWSPDGQRIAFDCWEPDGLDIYVADVNTGFARRLTHDPETEGCVAWSSDGRRLYFCSDRSGRFELYRMPTDGGAQEQLTSSGGTDAQESPDGRFIYFTKTYPMTDSPCGIWRMPVDGGTAVQVSEHGEYRLWQVLQQGICYLNRDVSPPVVELLDFASGDVRRVAVAEHATEWGFAVSPDQRWVLYQRGTGEADIMLVENFR
jgi:Tol biopolymer transport system component